MNWRDIVEGKNMNPFFKILVSLLKKTSPSIFKVDSPHVSNVNVFFEWFFKLIICYLFLLQDKFGVYNLSVTNEKYFSLFPKGDYKVNFFLEDENDDWMYGANIFTSLTSSVKLDGTK